MTYDAENLYIAAKCTEPNMKDLRTMAQSHDSDAIWLGDDLELFFALLKRAIMLLLMYMLSQLVHGAILKK